MIASDTSKGADNLTEFYSLYKTRILHNTDFRIYMNKVIETMTLHMNEIEFEKDKRGSITGYKSHNIIVASRKTVQESSDIVRVDLDDNLMCNIKKKKICSKLASSTVDEESNYILIKEDNNDNVFSSSEEDFSWVA